MSKNGSPDPVGQEIDAVAENSSPAATPYVMRVEMDRGRAAVVTLPDDINDSELCSLVAIIMGPGRVQIAAQRANPAGLEIARTMPRPRPV